ncbi:hypothetical protein C8Q75DRAFT_742075 [Abortiporus biennis]|nr:hypothetical protein C8Q75DRAFT_742075 [Abortiporus biennis]
MSLYSQAHAYGQPSYPPAGYHQPMPPPGSYNYLPPPPQPAYVDPSSFRRDYTTRLGELTVNSRPIIQNLSMVAQEFSRYAEIVAQCIEGHIRRVPPWMKLPSFYLLDAISKNVYEPYARYFTPLIYKLFVDTYEQVDQSTRSKMEEMLLTWRTGAPNQRELFGVGPQVAIERRIWGGDSTQASSSQRGQQGISTSQVLSELEFVLGQRERALQANPYDKLSQNHVAILQQLRKLVQAGVSQEELAQILNQLRTLSSAPPASQSTPSLPPPQLYPPTYPPIPSVQPTPSSQGPYSSQYPSSAVGQPKLEISEFASYPSTTVSASSVPHSSAPPPSINNISSLYNALLKAGVVSASSTPTGAGATAKAEAVQSNSDPVSDAAREYRKAILSCRINLNTFNVNKRQTPIASFLLDRLSGRCNQCGIRFADNATGKKELEGHLDMHFRQNRKANQSTGRGHSRGWYISVDDWTRDWSADDKGKGRADVSGPSNTKAAAAVEAAKVEAELRSLYVVVPPGDEATTLSCPICKEPLKSEFIEDDEEWVWRNAIKKDDKIYHATCHAEAAASKTNLAARLRAEVPSRSRSRTPEKVLRSTPPYSKNGVNKESPSPSKLSGLKRKADDDGLTSSVDDQDTPPTKKLALSMATS